MANRQLTADIVATAALAILDNELGFLTDVHKPYDTEFSQNINGYTPGSTISIRRPAEFTVRSGATADVQDVTEGKETLSIDQQKGIDFRFTSEELTLDIKDLSERVVRPAMVRLTNEIAKDCVDTWYPRINNLVGTAGQTIDSYGDYLKGVTRLNELATPMDSRCGLLSPTDWEGLASAQSGLFSDGIVNPAIREAEVGRLAGTKVRMSQLAPTLTTGTRSGSTLVDQTLTTSTTSYDNVRDTWVQTLHIDGFGGATQTVAAGDVFTIDEVYDVNPVTKAVLPHLKQFSVTTATTAAGSEVDAQITPPIIWSGANQTVSITGTTDINNHAITFVGTASTNYRQNIMFHKNAFTLAMVPMVMPAGSVDGARKSKHGMSVRVIPYYDGVSDYSSWRLDVLYGRKCIDNRIATRMYGTA